MSKLQLIHTFAFDQGLFIDFFNVFFEAFFYTVNKELEEI